MTETHGHPNGLIQRFQHWRRKRRILAEFAQLDAATRGDILHDLNLNEDDFARLADGPQNVHGLSEMLARLKADEQAMAKANPEFVAVLRRNCAMCTDWRQCEHELETGTAQYPAPSYCPNRETLASLAPKAS
mgnify:CR=1 FL=1|jgi:uncharacterized protein YjiS (DUF1127 family)